MCIAYSVSSVYRVYSVQFVQSTRVRYVSLVLPLWFHSVAVPGSIQTLLFWGPKLLFFIITITARTALSYPRAAAEGRSANAEVIHAQC